MAKHRKDYELLVLDEPGVNMVPDRKIILAVDFGTTYSGLAWAQTLKPEVQSLINQWPDASSGGLEGVTSEKVPTELKYNGQDYEWGFQIADFEARHQWFKLGLDPSQYCGTSNLAQLFPDPVAASPVHAFSIAKTVADYLTALRKHAEQIIRYKLLSGALQFTSIEFVVTIPAIWSDAGQAKTRACAEAAGMGKGLALHVISEPEAAATYALNTMDPHIINVGDTFVVCDAGGGTVDLISYTVSALQPMLKVTEAAPGNGSLCGSSFLNRIFRRTMTDTFAHNPAWDNYVLEEATKYFETIKRSFRGTVGEKFLIPVPGLSDNARLGVQRGRYCLKGEKLKKIFDPVVHEIITLVQEQIRATRTAVRAILLVGGFGQSAYLRDCIRAAVGGIEVMQSPNGWTAVVRGALMKGLADTSPTFASVKVSGRSARRHYGMESDKRYDPRKHDESKRFWSGYHNSFRVHTMDWIVEKGSTVEEDKPTRFPYIQVSQVDYGYPERLSVPVYVCSDVENEGAPLYRGSNVQKLVRLKADLRTLLLGEIPLSKGKDGEQYYLLEFEVEVTYLSAYTKYELIYNGVNYGAINAEYV